MIGRLQSVFLSAAAVSDAIDFHEQLIDAYWHPALPLSAAY